MGERSFVGHARTIGLLTLCSRVLGLTRDILCSHFFGAALVWDAFVIAFRAPNLFRRLFGEGALTAAFLPAFVHRWDSDRREEAHVLFHRVITRLALVLLLIILLGTAATWAASRIWTDEKTLLVCELLFLMLPYLFFICQVAILSATLQSLRHFAMPAFTPVLLNVVFIGAIILSAGKDIYLVAGAILLGGGVQLGALLPPLFARGIRFRIDLKKDEGVREVGAAFFPVLFGLALMQVNEIMDSVIAELCVPGHGAVSSLYYGSQINNLPLSLIGVSIATAVFPALASPREDTADLLVKALRGVFFLAIPAGVGLLLFARETVALIFEHGAFQATGRTAWVLRMYTLGLCFYCGNHILVRTFYALKDTRTPVKVSAAMVGVNFALNLTLVWPFREAGIAAATALSGLGSFLVLLAILRRRLPGLRFHAVGKTAGLSLAASLVMAAAAWALYRWVSLPLLPGASTLSETGRLLLPIAVAALLYFGLARLFRMEEARKLLRRRI